MTAIAKVESSFNPYALGVVGNRLVRQPRNINEAVATAKSLEEKGYNFSLGAAQVNRYNLMKYGIKNYTEAFSPCGNIAAGSRILKECYQRSGQSWNKAFSCYYSGNFVTGFKHGYVQKVSDALASLDQNIITSPLALSETHNSLQKINDRSHKISLPTQIQRRLPLIQKENNTAFTITHEDTAFVF